MADDQTTRAPASATGRLIERALAAKRHAARMEDLGLDGTADYWRREFAECARRLRELALGGDAEARRATSFWDRTATA